MQNQQSIQSSKMLCTIDCHQLLKPGIKMYCSLTPPKSCVQYNFLSSHFRYSVSPKYLNPLSGGIHIWSRGNFATIWWNCSPAAAHTLCDPQKPMQLSTVATSHTYIPSAQSCPARGQCPALQHQASERTGWVSSWQPWMKQHCNRRTFWKERTRLCKSLGMRLGSPSHMSVTCTQNLCENQKLQCIHIRNTLVLPTYILQGHYTLNPAHNKPLHIKVSVLVVVAKFFWIPSCPCCR